MLGNVDALIEKEKNLTEKKYDYKVKQSSDYTDIDFSEYHNEIFPYENYFTELSSERYNIFSVVYE